MKKTSMKKSSAGNGKRDMTVRARLSLTLGAGIFCVFLILLICVSYLVSSSVSKITKRDITDISEKNTNAITQIIKISTAISNVAAGSVDNLYSMMAQGMVDNTVTGVSHVTGQEMPAGYIEEEHFLMNTLWTAAKTYTNIPSIAVFLEPGVLSTAGQPYGFYVVNDDADKFTVHPVTDYLDYSYYELVKESGQTRWSKPKENRITGAQEISGHFPIMHDGKFMGIVEIDLPTTVFDFYLAENKAYKSMSVNIYTRDGSVVYSKDTSEIGKNVNDLIGEEMGNKVKKIQEAGKEFEMTINGRYCAFVPMQMGQNVWWIETSLAESEMNQARDQIAMVIVALEIISFVILVVLVMALISKALLPLQEMAKVAETMANGSLDVAIQYDRKDEIGMMADSMKKMVERIRSIMGDLNDKLNSLADGNFRINHSKDGLYIGDYVPLKVSVDTITDKLNDTLQNIYDSAMQVNTSSEQVAAGAQALAQGSTEQASSVEELSATMNEISDKVRETAEKGQRANEISKDSVASIELSNQKMEEMSNAMNEIIERSDAISKIIKTIDDIAFQTNILSLNAAIEAARAGQAGKGFAVVADEVGNLAKKSQEAARNTAVLIEQTIEAVQRGGKITEETAAAMNQVSESSEQIQGIIQEISAASEEQSKGITQITIGIDQISSVVQTNSATAEESAAASEELSGQANNMRDLVGRFQLKK